MCIVATYLSLQLAFAVVDSAFAVTHLINGKCVQELWFQIHLFTRRIIDQLTSCDPPRVMFGEPPPTHF